MLNIVNLTSVVDGESNTKNPQLHRQHDSSKTRVSIDQRNFFHVDKQNIDHITQADDSLIRTFNHYVNHEVKLTNQPEILELRRLEISKDAQTIRSSQQPKSPETCDNKAQERKTHTRTFDSSDKDGNYITCPTHHPVSQQILFRCLVPHTTNSRIS